MIDVGRTLTLARAAELAGGELVPPTAAAAAVPIAGASIDSRTVAPGQLFVPLPGRRSDGHAFLPAAFARGAAAALCARAQRPAPGAAPGTLILVDDVTAALQRLANGQRRAWGGLVIGVTGSSGKTTTKDLIAAALAADRPTLATRGNLNNHWGVPLTLLDLGEQRAAVIEMGSNHPGEIAALAAIALPDLAVITNAGSAHLEHFGSVAAIATEKASLAAALPRDGVAFAGADSPPLLEALARLGRRTVTYGFAPGADVTPRSYQDLGDGGSRLEVDGFPPLVLGLVGRHHAVNALAAFAVARHLGLDPKATVAALAAHRGSAGRMEVRRAAGGTLLVDCYNANPESARAALRTLLTWPHATRRIAVLGDMLELGPKAAALHRETGAAAAPAELWVVGAHAADYAAGARDSGADARVFDDKPALARALAEALEPGVVALIKASRGASLEDVLQGLELE
jgi:UDP-N-acetylmuramoyl-tripeptide--D-alanyl-D-alanine ligase